MFLPFDLYLNLQVFKKKLKALLKKKKNIKLCYESCVKAGFYCSFKIFVLLYKNDFYKIKVEGIRHRLCKEKNFLKLKKCKLACFLPKNQANTLKKTKLLIENTNKKAVINSLKIKAVFEDDKQTSFYQDLVACEQNNFSLVNFLITNTFKHAKKAGLIEPLLEAAKMAGLKIETNYEKIAALN